MAFQGTRNVLDSYIVIPTSYTDGTYTNVGIQDVSYQLKGNQSVTTGTGVVYTNPTFIALQSTGISGRWRIISSWTANFSAYDIDRVNITLLNEPSFLEDVLVVDGPSGGGGNTGDTGGSSGGNPNNMSAVHLSLNYEHGDTATQDVNITVYGESAEALSPDHTVVVNVPVATLKELITFSSGYPGGSGATGTGSTAWYELAEDGTIVQFPNIDFNPAVVLDIRGAGIKTNLTSTVRNGLLVHDGNDDVFTLFRELYQLEYSADSLLNSSIPVEAIKSQIPQSINIRDLDAVIEHIGVTGGSSPTLDTDQQKALASLFEVAVAQGRVTKEDASVHLDLVEGDSITVYVRYLLKQTRRYRADPDVLAHSGATSAGVVSLTFAGKTFDIEFDTDENATSTDGDGTHTEGADDGKETASDTKLYAFKFVASATSSSIFA